jgi:hypothetical protein
MELVIALKFTLGFVIPKELNDLPNMSDNLSEQPCTWLTPKRTILCLFCMLFLGHCIGLNLVWAQFSGGS